MRPVNLLPAKNRPHQPTGNRSGSSYILMGMLVLLLGAVVTYVLETNKITQSKNDIALAEQKAADARTKAQQLGPFGDFAKIADQRVASVKQLADGRFDWERSMRELAHLLPKDVWLIDFQANVAGSAATASGADTANASTGPAMTLHGCSLRQPLVAQMLVRLKEMEGVADVVLKDSVRQLEPAKATDVVGDSAGGGGGQCGTHKGLPNYEFNATVTFDAIKPVPADPNKGSKVPVRLGGGS